MIATDSSTCFRCQVREGSRNRDGLVLRGAFDAVARIGKRLTAYICRECETPWTLIEEVGTGRPPILVRGVLV